MLSFAKMENFYKLTTAIGKYEVVLKKTDEGLKAMALDDMPRNKGIIQRKSEELLLQREKAQQRLPVLKALREHNLPAVENTINQATENCKMAIALRRKMIFQLRYMQGLEWNEIAECLQVKDPRKIVLQSLESKR